VRIVIEGMFKKVKIGKFEQKSTQVPKWAKFTHIDQMGKIGKMFKIDQMDFIEHLYKK